jgi:hypothetical protein
MEVIVCAETTRKTMRCAGCGYGVSVLYEPAVCPMCHGASWTDEVPRESPSFGEFLGVGDRDLHSLLIGTNCP